MCGGMRVSWDLSPSSIHSTWLISTYCFFFQNFEQFFSTNLRIFPKKIVELFNSLMIFISPLVQFLLKQSNFHFNCTREPPQLNKYSVHMFPLFPFHSASYPANCKLRIKWEQTYCGARSVMHKIKWKTIKEKSIFGERHCVNDSRLIHLLLLLYL